ncbi:hypothetical protein BD779DRAFT_1494229 [Infundibulicybe gibba]|nr:hypothetical protein BD779DRAFT_1494229 [Infundibulicybe gibba]
MCDRGHIVGIRFCILNSIFHALEGVGYGLQHWGGFLNLLFRRGGLSLQSIEIRRRLGFLDSGSDRKGFTNNRPSAASCRILSISLVPGWVASVSLAHVIRLLLGTSLSAQRRSTKGPKVFVG